MILHLTQFAPRQQTCVLPRTVLDSVCRVHVQKNQKELRSSFISCVCTYYHIICKTYHINAYHSSVSPKHVCLRC